MRAKVLYAPIVDDPAQDPRFVRLGVRIELPSKHRWFFCYRFKTWTSTLPGVKTYYKSGTPVRDSKGNVVLTAEKKTGPYRGDEGLLQHFSHCKDLVRLLVLAREQAELEDEAKRTRA